MSFLNSIDGLRPSGKNKWRGKCPVHMGSNPTALSIIQNSDGSFGLKCFNCDANGVDVFNALGVPLDELFGFRELNKDHKVNYITQVQKDQANEDRMFIAIYDAAKGRNDTIAYSDHKRHKLAVNRLQGIATLTIRN